MPMKGKERKTMAKDRSMNDEDWNKWTEDIRTWLSDVDNHMAKSIAAGMDEDVVEECIDDIQKHLARGDKRELRRQINKQNIQDAGRDLNGWPKIRGIASSLPEEVQATQNTVLAGYDMAYTAFYNTLEEQGIAHYEMQRASKKDGGTDGTPYANVEAFVKAKHNSVKQGLTRDYNSGLWNGLNVSDPVLRPFIPKEGEEGSEEDSPEDSE